MPRPRARPLFEFRGQWIAPEPGRTGLYRFWNDAGHGRTRRESLRTEDLDEAKDKLIAIVVRGAPKNANTRLSVAFEAYFIDRTDHLPSANAAHTAGALFLECWGEMTRIGVIDEGLQKTFVKWSYERGHSAGYVARNMGVLAAALNHAHVGVDVIYTEGRIAEKWPDLKPRKGPRKIFEPTDEELARLLATKQPENLQRWVLNAMATLARPEAVLDLSPASRICGEGMIDLNPEGRRQNKKYRPKVREPRRQTRWLDKWDREIARAAEIVASNDDARPPRYCGYASVDSVDTALWRACGPEGADLPRMSVYSIRHRGTTVLREAGVLEEKINAQLGHRRPEGRTSRGYGSFPPSYFEETAAALDAWITRVLRMAEQIKKPKRAGRVA